MTLANMIADDALPNEYIEQISYVDLENSFNVSQDNNGFYKFNLNSTVVIDPDGDYKYFEVMQDMQWPLISYKIYGDTREAWMLMKINEVGFDDVFKPVKAGTKIKYLETT